MIVYKCRFTGDEMFSDAFRPRPVLDDDGNEVEGLIQIQSQKVDKDSGTALIDIGCGNEFGIYSDAVVDDTIEYVNNVIDANIGFDLHEVELTKHNFKEYLQNYCKTLRQKLKDDENVPGPQVKQFTLNAPIFVKWLLRKYNDLQLFTNSSMNPNGAMAFAYYHDIDPVFIYIKAGLYEEKC